MSQVMIGTADTDALAAEYVLGTLDSDERSQVQSLLSVDEVFALKVKVWERRLSELHLMVEPVEPDPQIWERIKARMPELQSEPAIEPAEPVSQAVAPVTELPPPIAEVPAPLTETPAPDAETTAPTVIATVAEAPGSIATTAETPAADPQPHPPATPAAVPPPEIGSFPDPVAAPEPSASTVPPAAADAVPSRAEARTRALESNRVLRPRFNFWRLLAAVMTLVVAAVAALIAAWRFAPEQVPPALQPIELLARLGIDLPKSPAPSQRPVAPPQSQFDE